MLVNRSSKGETFKIWIYLIPYFLCWISCAEVNKPIILSSNALDEILPLLKSEMLFVQFKLLGTARMLVDGMGRSIKANVPIVPKKLQSAFQHQKLSKL